jgi:hypothetical protein
MVSGDEVNDAIALENGKLIFCCSIFVLGNSV